jgi:hypothetical protein
MPYKTIMLKEKVHRKLQKVAEANGRSMAGQIEYLLKDACTHPADKRRETVPVSSTDGRALRVFVICEQCGRVLS